MSSNPFCRRREAAAIPDDPAPIMIIFGDSALACASIKQKETTNAAQPSMMFQLQPIRTTSNSRILLDYFIMRKPPTCDRWVFTEPQTTSQFERCLPGYRGRSSVLLPRDNVRIQKAITTGRSARFSVCRLRINALILMIKKRFLGFLLTLSSSLFALIRCSSNGFFK